MPRKKKHEHHHHHKHHHAVRFEGFFHRRHHKLQEYKHCMNFSLFSNQHGTLVVVAVDGAGNPQPLPTDLTASSSNASILEAAPTSTPGSFLITAHAVSAEQDITIQGTNSQGTVISTVFTFALTAAPVDTATGFTATLINVTNN